MKPKFHFPAILDPLTRRMRTLVFPWLALAGLGSAQAADPASPAPTPTHPAAQVIALYNSSGTYTNAVVDTWSASWDQATLADFEIPGTGRKVKQYTNLNYAGVEFINPKIDATGMTTFHVDIWTPNATKFAVKLVSFSPGVAERQIEFTSSTIVQNSWVSLDIPLSQFAGVNMSSLAQLLFVDNVGGVENGTFFVDNVYFYDNGTVVPPPPVPTAAAPTPTRPADEVQSLFNTSGTYLNESVSTWRTSWSVGNLNDYTIEGTTEPVKKYSSVNYVGINMGPLDLTGKTTFHMNLWTPDATKFSLKLVSAPGTPAAAEKEIFFTNTTITQQNWISLNIPLSQFTGVDMTSVSQMLFIDNAGAGGPEFGTFYVDNVYFYDDGSIPPPPVVPVTAAPLPNRPADKVKSLYNSSATYTDEPVDTWRTGWSAANLADYTIAGTANPVKKYTNLNYAGVDFANPAIDASTMTTIHLDLWTPDATKFSIKLVSAPGTPGAAEKEIFFNNTVITQKNWVSLNIPLSQFTGVDLSNLSQMLFIDNQGGVENGTFYIDNVYFFDDGSIPPPPVVPTVAAPLPTAPAAFVKSLFNSSGTYQDEPVDTWRTGWSAANYSEYLISGTSTPVKKYSNLNYAGVEFANPALDASAMSSLNLHLWTPDATKFSVKLVSAPGTPAAAEKEIFFNNTVITQRNWVSLSIPLSQFTGVNLANLSQLLFVNNDGGVENGTFYIDNVYFQGVAQSEIQASAAPGVMMSWTAGATGSYQPQRSSDGSTWVSFGNAFTGNAVTSAFDPQSFPFHRVLATPPGGSTSPIPATSQAGIQLAWPTTAGKSYQIKTSANLGTWAPLGAAIPGSGSPGSHVDAVDSDRKFYRIFEQ